jgi:hypothetical protein
MASSRVAAHMRAAPRRGNSVTHHMMCVASTGLIAPSVNAEKEWSAVRYQDAAQPHVAVTYQKFVTCVRASTLMRRQRPRNSPTTER